MMLLCLILKILYILSEREKAKHNLHLGKDPKIPHMRDKKGSLKESLSFISKIYKNSRMKVDPRIWNTVLDLIVLSFNYSRPK